MESFSKKSLQCPNCGANVAAEAISCEFCRAVLTVTACPSCFGAVFKGMKHCPACGAAVERVEVKDDRKLTCPRCEQRLTSADIGGTRILECLGCGGVWLDEASFQSICADREKQEKVVLYPARRPAESTAPTEQPQRFYVPCPECGDLMNRKNFAGCSGVVVDICTRHGIWFDRQELQRIADFIKDGGLHKARANELANLKAEQDRLADMKYAQSVESLRLQDDVSPLGFHNEDSLFDAVIGICSRIFNK